MPGTQERTELKGDEARSSPDNGILTQPVLLTGRETREELTALLTTLAVHACRHAFCPVTSLREGAAILCSNQHAYFGSAVETRGIAPIHPLEAALATAIAHGEATQLGPQFITAAAVAGAGDPCLPPGCLQRVSLHFLNLDASIAFTDGTGHNSSTVPIGQLLPTRPYTQSLAQRGVA